jgi:uncharacterized protein (DUF433 family)
MATDIIDQASDVATPNPVVSDLIGIRAGYCGGKPHILGHRIKVQHIAIWHQRMGLSAEEIVATHPNLNLAQVYSALAYYHSHRADVDADIAADEKFIGELQSRSGPSILDRIRAARHAADDPLSSR